MKQFIEINETLISTDTITTIERTSNVSLCVSFKSGDISDFNFSSVGEAFEVYSDIRKDLLE